MERKRAVMVHVFSAEVLDPDWHPTISEDELIEANHNLEKDHVQWRWRWMDRVTNLAGAIEMKEGSDNAQLQFSSP